MKGEVGFVREIEKRCSSRSFSVFRRGVMIALALTFLLQSSSGTAYATAPSNTVRHGRIEAVPGFLFENIVYAWDKLTLDVVNITSSNRFFEGTMVFLDRRGRQVARANLLPRKIVGQRSERYIAYFEAGSGETARRALRVIWDFGAAR